MTRDRLRLADRIGRVGLLIAGLLAAGHGASAQAPARPAAPTPPTGRSLMSTPAKPPSPAAPAPATPAAAAPGSAAPSDKKPDPAFEAARATFEALPEADRRAIQDALVWTGDFNGVDTGTFGRRTFDAMLAYQRRIKTAADGTLDERERAGLLATGRSVRDAAGFATRLDKATGVALGVPVKALTREQAQPHGTRWQNGDGRVTLETRSFALGETDLGATFDRLTAAAPDRKVTYKLKRPDFLVVTGETPTGRFYVRYADTPAGLRGFTFSYDKALAAETDKLVIAVANSFVPQPGDAVATVAKPPSTAAPATGAGLPVAPVAPVAARPSSATTFEVASGRLLVGAAALDACPGARLGAAPVRVIARSDALALLAGPERPGGTFALHLGREPAAADPLVVLASDGTAATVLAGEAATPSRITAPLQPGGAGAPVFDRKGGLVGVVGAYPSAPRLVAGIVPTAGYDMVPGSVLAAFLRDNGVTIAEATSSAIESVGEIAAANAPAIRTLSCGR